MNHTTEGGILGNGMTFRSVRESRFKTGCISVHFVTPLTREDATVNAVLAGLFKRSCARYPAFVELRRELAMLYGAEISAAVSALGDCQMITVEVAMTDDRFIPGGESVAAGCAELLCEMIFRPAREPDGSLFREEDVAIALRIADERIRSRVNDKGEYAMRRCAEIMCEGEPYGIDARGRAEDLPSVTRERLALAWDKLLRTAAVNIITVGTADAEAVARRFAEEFSRIDRDFQALPAPSVRERASSERAVTERMDVQQSKMVIGMRLPIAEPNDRTMAACLMSMLYGGTAVSLLFSNVREKMSLCYYCSSVYLRKNGLLFVRSGLEEENAEKAADEIKRQLQVIADNAFTDESFTATKLYAASAFAEVNDSVYSLERWYAMQFMDGCVRTPEQAAERMNAVTRQEVADCAAKVNVDTVYLLAPQRTDEAEGGDD